MSYPSVDVSLSWWIDFGQLLTENWITLDESDTVSDTISSSSSSSSSSGNGDVDVRGVRFKCAYNTLAEEAIVSVKQATGTSTKPMPSGRQFTFTTDSGVMAPALLLRCRPGVPWTINFETFLKILAFMALIVCCCSLMHHLEKRLRRSGSLRQRIELWVTETAHSCGSLRQRIEQWFQERQLAIRNWRPPTRNWRTANTDPPTRTWTDPPPPPYNEVFNAPVAVPAGVQEPLAGARQPLAGAHEPSTGAQEPPAFAQDPLEATRSHVTRDDESSINDNETVYTVNAEKVTRYRW